MSKTISDERPINPHFATLICDIERAAVQQNKARTDEEIECAVDKLNAAEQAVMGLLDELHALRQRTADMARAELEAVRDEMADRASMVRILESHCQDHPLGGAIAMTDHWIEHINKRLATLTPSPSNQPPKP